MSKNKKGGAPALYVSSVKCAKEWGEAVGAADAYFKCSQDNLDSKAEADRYYREFVKQFKEVERKRLDFVKKQKSLYSKSLPSKGSWISRLNIVSRRPKSEEADQLTGSAFLLNKTDWLSLRALANLKSF